MEIKVLYHKNGKHGEEIGISINGRITFLDNMFDNTLGERGITFDEYKVLPIKEKVDDLISHAIDTYYYNGKEAMVDVFKENFKRNINDFEIIDEQNCDKELIINMIKFPTEQRFMKQYQDEIIKNIFSQ